MSSGSEISAISRIVAHIIEAQGHYQIICPPIIGRKAIKQVLEQKLRPQSICLSNYTDSTIRTLSLADFTRSLFTLAFNVPSDSSPVQSFSHRLMQPDCLHSVKQLVLDVSPCFIIDNAETSSHILELYPLFTETCLVILTSTPLDMPTTQIIDLGIPELPVPRIVPISRDKLFSYCKTKTIIADEYFHAFLYALNDVSSTSFPTRSSWVAKTPRDLTEISIYDAVVILDRLAPNAMEFLTGKVEFVIFTCQLGFDIYPPSMTIPNSMVKQLHHLCGLFVGNKFILSYFHALLHFHGFQKHSLLVMTNPRTVDEWQIKAALAEIEKRVLPYTTINTLTDVSQSLISPTCANDVVKTCMRATDLTPRAYITYYQLCTRRKSFKMKPKHLYRLQVIKSYAELYNECMRVSKSSGVIISELQYNSKYMFTKNDLLTFLSHFSDETWGNYLCCPPKYRKFYQKYIKYRLKLISDRVSGDILTPLAQAPSPLLQFVKRNNVNIFDHNLLDYNHLDTTSYNQLTLSDSEQQIVDSFLIKEPKIFKIVEAMSRYPNSVPWISTFVITPPASLVGNHFSKVPILIPVGPIVKNGSVHILSMQHFVEKKNFIILPWPSAECEMILVGAEDAMLIRKITDYFEGKRQPELIKRSDAISRWSPSTVDVSLLRRFLFVFSHKNPTGTNRFIRQLAEAFPATIEFQEKILSPDSNVEWNEERSLVKVDEYEIIYSSLPPQSLRNLSTMWEIVKERVKYFE